MKTRIIAAAALALALGLPAAKLTAQVGHNGHDTGGHSMPGMTKPAPAAASPSTKAYKTANAKMHKDMAIDFTGDADVDFAHGMIPHHQGAIDMAKVVLQYGKDWEVRQLAQEIIQAQEQEIAELQEILQRLQE